MRHLARVHVDAAKGRAANGEELTRFCTHCASLFDAPAAAGTPNRGRVCARCGLGVVLTCASATLTSEGAAFLVVTAELRVSAASERAEEMFAITDGAYGRPLLSLLTSPAGLGELARIVVRCANGAMAPTTIAAEAASSDLGALEARIGGCGNPPAALVVVDAASA
jgi:hypothetical protein